MDLQVFDIYVPDKLIYPYYFMVDPMTKKMVQSEKELIMYDGYFEVRNKDEHTYYQFIGEFEESGRCYVAGFIILPLYPEILRERDHNIPVVIDIKRTFRLKNHIIPNGTRKYYEMCDLDVVYLHRNMVPLTDKEIAKARFLGILKQKETL